MRRPSELRARPLALFALGLGLGLGCGPTTTPVPLRIVPLGADPFRGADAIVLRVERPDGTLLTEETLPGDARDFVLGPLPFEPVLRVTMETRLGTLPLARGRSFPFGVDAAGVTGTADVTLGVVGRHAALDDRLPAVATAVAATASGALVATADGIVPFVAHDTSGRPALAAPVALPASRLGARVVALGGGLLLVGGAAAGATYVGPDGALGASSTRGPVAGAALVPISETEVLVAGGTDGSGAITDEVLLVSLEAGALVTTLLEPLPAPRTDARAHLVEAMSATGSVPRVLVEGGRDAGGPRTDVVVLDPTGTAASFARTLGAPADAAIVAIEVGQILWAGGTSPDGTVTDAVALYFLDDAGNLEPLSPAPRPLYRARRGARALRLSSGVAMVIGGSDASGALADVELADLRVLPGRLVFTGSLPIPSASPHAALLGDGTVLVSEGPALSLYFPSLP